MTQTMQIRQHLESGRAITPLDALNLYGCFRLGARIWDLRHKHNLEIDMHLVHRGKKVFASYRLKEGKK